MDRPRPQLLLEKHGRGLFALLLCLTGAALYLGVLDHSYPIASWLVWDLATLWGWSLAFVLACLGVGLKVLRLLDVPRGGLSEAGTLGMAAGVTVFGLSLYALGALAWFRAAPAVALIAAMLVVGYKELGDYLPALLRRAAHPSQRTLTGTLACVFGGLCLVFIYLTIVTPDALNYDATWAHVVIAEDYAREGYLAPFWGSYTRNVPHLASIIYTWAYLVPGLDTPLRWMLILHLEFVLFVWTLVGISAAVRWLVRDRHVAGTWASLFLFPIIFVYDSNLGGAADHVLAFFAMPLLLTLRLALPGLAPGPCYLLAILAGGAALTKYQALYLLLPLLPALTVRWSTLLYRELRARRASEGERKTPNLALLAWTPGIMLGLFLLVFAPHLAKNLYYHENPVYPFMSTVFTHSTPSVPNAALYVDYIFKDQRWVPTGGLLDKALHAARLFFTFSFSPHYSFTKEWPIFGPLFTLLLPALLVVRERRVLLAAGIASLAVFLWAFTFNVDRNLQVFLPYLVCVTAALLVRLWSMGTVARLGVGTLVACQVVAGADAMFYTEQPSLQSTMHLFSSGYDGRAASRYATFRATHRAIGNALPADARVLLHTHHVSLGINREVIFDWAGYQGLVSYAHVATVHDLVRYYRSLGMTHVLYVPGEWQAPSRKEQALFDRFVTEYSAAVRSFPPYRLLAIPERPPPQRKPMLVATLGMPGYSDGLYSIDQMNVNEYLPVELRAYPAPKTLAQNNEQRAAILSRADAVFVGAGRVPTPEESLQIRTLQRVSNYPGLFTLYLRRGKAIGSPRAPSGSRSGAAPSGAHTAP